MDQHKCPLKTIKLQINYSIFFCYRTLNKNGEHRNSCSDILLLTLKFVYEWSSQSADFIYLGKMTVSFITPKILLQEVANTPCKWAKTLLLGLSKSYQWIKIYYMITVINPICSIIITDSKNLCSLKRTKISYALSP